MRGTMDFIEILRDIIVDYNLNQTELAKKIGVKQSQVSEWLKGKSKPSYDNLKQICLTLDISADRLLDLD
jgi:transcriptional regulator with XRE-family HTH domain